MEALLNKMVDNLDYSDSITETTMFKCGSLNLHDFKNNIGVSIDGVNEDNYRNMIEYALKNNFKMCDVTKVSFAFFGNVVKFMDLSFNDLLQMKHGHIYKIMLCP